ncbi:MAG: cell division protein FtsW, partial [Candidatus Krumholzibacteriota bacterium]|nr:cell division protein FtsW [Candidatus Krumholzibacteriota bacterium]
EELRENKILMRQNFKYDIKLFYITLSLVALGLVMVFSASQIIARQQFSSPFFFMQKHAIRVALGLCCLFVFMKIPFRVYQRLSLWILIVSVLLLAAIFVWGREARGANRWLPVFKFVLQPVEVAKYALVIFLAARISYLGKGIKNLERGFLPLVGVSLLLALMITLQPNVSNAVLLIFLSLTLLFLGGCRILHLAGFTGLILAAAFPLLYRMSQVRERFDLIFRGTEDPLGAGWHIKQSLIALGSGFIHGCGFGKGHQKFSFLPDAHTDFIYSIIGEELGILGTVTVLILFAVIFARTLRIAKDSPNSFGYLLALGIGMTIVTTALINMSMTLGLIPTAGLPLPFISYGGSSLVTSMSAVGILLNISAQRKTGARRGADLKKKKRSPGVYARRINKVESV